MSTSNFVLDTGPGDHINTVAKNAQAIAIQRNVTVEFDFNGIKVLINDKSNLDNLFRTYGDAFTMEWNEIGPEYLDVYPEDVQAELKTKTEALQKKYEEEEKIYREEMNKKVAILNGKIEGIALAVKDAVGLQTFKDKNTDPYGAGIMKFADQWGRLMQYEMNNGKTLEEVADATSHEADYGIGITGFMYGAAVSVLSLFWEFGEQLRVWHNKSYDHDGDGVVNPAVITLNV